ncbi:HD domain-containing protein [Rhizobacter sp. LjRoot28]|uniref:HD domain-containing protein n=1 Tax=Rhizobacter sp. LjRoot28 TaxID=3342309 RepID=UPI003ED1716E
MTDHDAREPMPMPMTLPPLPSPLIDNLKVRLAEPHRHYHTLSHVESLLKHLHEWRHLAERPEIIEAAIWYHDVVYDPRLQDNEIASADIARFELMSIGWLGVDVERVAGLVEATRHHAVADGDRDGWLFLDLDLAILGAPADAYDHYRDAIRAEYAWVPEERYLEGRAAVLRGFLERDAIYRTPALQAAWEAPARGNLARELQWLRR